MWHMYFLLYAATHIEQNSLANRHEQPARETGFEPMNQPNARFFSQYQLSFFSTVSVHQLQDWIIGVALWSAAI